MRPICLLLTLIGIAPLSAHAQVFIILDQAPPPANQASQPGPRPAHATIVALDPALLWGELQAAPQEQVGTRLADYGAQIAIPGPGGTLVNCFIARSPVMEAELAAQFPQIQTFIVQSADASATGRLELAPRGLTAMLRTPDGTWMIDPWQSADPAHAVAYWMHDVPGTPDWVCETTPGIHGFGSVEDPELPASPRALQTLRTLRLAVACTGEFGAYHSALQGHAPNTADPLAAVVTVVSRANVVFEADLAVRFNLIGNNNLIMYSDPATDPYPTTCDGTGGADCSGSLLSPNISNLAAVIGNTNFDIGHLVTRVAGGVAYLSSVCGNNKGGGVSGIPRGGDTDPFSHLIFIHEVGHQFGANHTFSGARGRCAGNVNLSTAWEAGSGSSPMGYAGGCPVGDAPPSDNVAIFADPFFHHGSYNEMRSFITGASCPVQSATTNNIPVINSTSESAPIPPGTPFVLKAVATDADGDALTYSWEQFDSGVSRPLSGAGSADNGAGALFRAFPPVISPERTFPRIADILSGVPTPGEQLPTVTGAQRRFRVLVRDNRAGAGGAVVSSMVTLTVQAGTTPFTATAPAQGDLVSPGSANVQWTVGNTTAAPISCASVVIRLSTDGGATFPTLLGTFPNTGAATVTMPTLLTNSAARVRIEGSGRVWFTISRPFTLLGSCPSDFNADEFSDAIDYDLFIAAWLGGSTNADFNNDGFVDAIDYDEFIAYWVAGC